MRKVRHKDIKGQNVLVKRTASGTNLLLTDFGIAMDFSEIAKSTTKGPQAQKTERYCAPEVAGGRERGRRSDVYSLGCLFVEVATVMIGFDLKTLDDSIGGDGVFHESELQLANWISKLERMAEESMAIVMRWIPPMIRKHPGSRPQMLNVIDTILKDTKTHKELRGKLFCAICTDELRELRKISSSAPDLKVLNDQEDSDYGSGKFIL
jgi:serine/threonine protein kinase